MRTALCPGSFDPFHNGHLEVVERACRLFDDIVVAVIGNPQKAGQLFSMEDRVAMIEESTAHLGNVRALSRGGLTVDVAREVGAVAIVKGLRTVADFDMEMQMAQMNSRLSAIETVFVPTGAANSYLASRLLREVALLGGYVSDLVPPAVAKRLEAKLTP